MHTPISALHLKLISSPDNTELNVTKAFRINRKAFLFILIFEMLFPASCFY